ncbi:MAG: VWA domain-containing protein [Bacteroidetes bacterium]|uniref:VWA domain-containing protein n=1 Tax=Candidatus Cryptobacteroides excrementipullorum TaxID=2840761 RepID=A0A9D9NMJ0_9BACT|nr:VWA domain-containing protein [Candidatus Cryptobacteroides excrementipullorum]
MFFEYPKILWLEIVPVLLILHYLYLELAERKPHLRVSTSMPWKLAGGSVLGWMRHFPFVLRILAIVMIIIAMARPRSSSEMERVDTEGIDIMLTMDVSTSMLARDFKPDRISAAKDIAIEFISQRPSDRIGIVVFAGESYTQCPLTTDRATLINLMKEVQTDLIEDGTAIGNGLATAVARLKDSNAKSRVVILLTDGVNNRGEITPQTAAEIAKTYGVRVYTIGVGAMGTAPYPVVTPWGVEVQNVRVEIDEDLLTEIAEATGGRYFRATDNTKLMEIYSEINKMEKDRTTIDSFPVYKELFGRYAVIALVALMLELVLRLFVIRRLP